jgi:hypothetical protein
MNRDSNYQMLSWFTDQYRMGNLDLEPPYQRKSVWNNDYKVYFIDTILRNFPCPTIFLEIQHNPNGTTKYHVVDGKQRLLTVIEFVKDEFAISEKYSEREYANKYFSELPDKTKTDFWGYKFTIENIKDTSREDLNQCFDRLNRNVARLNAQELRHARYEGAFITLVSQLADDPFWSDMGISTSSRIRRMVDIEYVSEIFLVVMHGIQDGREHLDYYYAIYDEEIPDLDINRRKYEVCKNYIACLNLYKTRYTNLADLYSLWSTLTTLYNENNNSLNIDIERTRENLLEFADKIKDDLDDTETQFYAWKVRQASNSIGSRQARQDMLKKLIVVK